MGSQHDYYDQQLTASLWNAFHTSSTHIHYSWNLGSRSTLAVTGSNGSSSQFDGEDTYYYYHNFRSIIGVDFTVTFGGSSASVPSTFDCDENTSMANVTLAGQGVIAGENVRLENLTFTQNGGWMTLSGGSAALDNLTAQQDFDTLELYGSSGGTIIASNVNVRRKMRNLTLGDSTGRDLGSWDMVDTINVSGALSSVYVGGGAILTSLSVGTQRSWGAADSSAFVNYDGDRGSWTHSSATYMTVASGGTAKNIFLGNGGEMVVLGRAADGSGTGGVVENLQMATAGGLQLDGAPNPRVTWDYPTNGYANSKNYMSAFIATAPQSANLQLNEFTIGRNIQIGNGGFMSIALGASATNVSMGALTTSTWFTNSSGVADLWIGDRGPKLIINGGYASDVVVEAPNMTFDYYSATHDYYWLYSSGVSARMQEAYYAANSSYANGSEWEAQVSASVNADGYRKYMRGQYASGSNYTQLGSDGGYSRMYVGGEVAVNNGVIENLSGFATLNVLHYGTSETVNGAYVYSGNTIENVSQASGLVSATIQVGGGAHLTSVTAPGGMVVMGYDGKGIYRMTGQTNPQSNFARIENLDLRTEGLAGDNNSAVIIFTDSQRGSGMISMPVFSEGVQVVDSEGLPQYNYYGYDCMDPGEIVYASGNSGLTVSGTYGRFTYIGDGAIVINALGTIGQEQIGSRDYSSSGYYSSGVDGTSRYVQQITRWLAPSSMHYEFGVVKGLYDEETGNLLSHTVLDGEAGFDWKGVLAVGSGATVSNVGSKAGLLTGNTLFSSSWNPVIELDASKMLYVLAGGSADNVAVTGKVTNYERTSQSLYRSNAALFVSSGGTATNVTVLSGGIAMAEGGTIDGVFVGNGGILYLSGWGGARQVSEDGGKTIEGPQYLDTTVLNGIRLGSGGQLGAVYDYQFAGTAPSIIANADGGILNGVTANGAAYMSGVDFAGAVNLTSGQQAVDVTVRGFTTITATDDDGNPTAWNTTIAYMNVSSGGIVSGATVGEDGAIYVSDGAAVNDLTASGGRLIFGNSSGWSDYFPGSATVADITLEDGGILQVNSKFALTATQMQLHESAGLEINIAKDADENYAKTELNGTWSASWGSGTFQTQNGVLSGFGGQFGYKYLDPIYSREYTSARLSMTIRKGAALSSGDLKGYGFVTVSDGGKMINTRLQGITGNIGASGYASGLTAITDPSGSAYDTNIYVYGSNALAEKTLLSGGYLCVETGGVADGVTMLAPEGYEGPAGDAETVGPAELEITAGGTAKNVVASAGVITILKGANASVYAAPILSAAEVHSAASLLVNEDGVVLAGTLKLGGTVVTTATHYEWLEVEVTDPDTANITTEWQRIEKNNAVADAKTLTLTFDLTERDGTETVAMIDMLSNLDGVTLAGITISATQALGTYVLAKDASAFTGSLTVTCGNATVCTLAVGETKQGSGGFAYSLANDAETGLCFSIQSNGPAVEKIVATVDGKELANGQWTNKAVTIKAQVNQYSDSVWYRIRNAVARRGGIDEWLELDTENGITITEYCDMEFKAKDQDGNESEIVTYTVNYDATPATIDGFYTDVDVIVPPEGTTANMVFDVEDDLDAAPKVEVSIAGGEWQVVAPDEGTIYSVEFESGASDFTVRVTDHAGNVSTLGTTLAEAPVASADILTATNQNVTVTASFNENDIFREYSLDGAEWDDYSDDGVVLEQNGTVYFRAANVLGYSEVTEFVVSNIDKEAPKAPTAAANVTNVTNGDVAVTATFSADTTVKEYSIDGTTWFAYTKPIVFEENGTVAFRGTDAAGNVSEVTTFVVSNIDKVAPKAPTAAANVTNVTNGDVAVTATFSADSTVKEYSLDDGETWQAYTTSIVFEENGTVLFRGTDAAGNLSDVTTFVVSNIDKEAPAAPTAAADVTTPTNGAVAVTATFSADSTVKEYSLDGGETWEAYTTSIVFEENGDIAFRGTDATGNVSDVTTFVVSNIDKVAPTAPTAVANVTTLTNGDVAVTATFSADTAVKEYSLDGTTWLAYTKPIVFEENGTVAFRGTDAAGNVSEVTTFVVSNIDKVAPTAPTAVADITELTNGDVAVTATFSNDTTVKEYSLDDGESWEAYTTPIVFEENGTVLFRGTDAAGNVSEVTTCNVTNIDKVAPTAPTAAADVTAPTNGDVTVTATFSADTTVKEYSLDGESWEAYTTPIVFEENGTVAFRGTDAAGNVSDVTTCNVTNIDKVAPTAPTAAANVTTPTNGEVAVTATFSDDTAVKEYSLDGESWEAYTTSIVFEENGTVLFRGTDAAGNLSEVTSFAVTNIDKVAPVITLTGDTTTSLRSSTLTATTEDGLEILYSTDNETWMPYEGEIAVTENGTYWFQTTDAAGNTGTATITFENIRKSLTENTEGVIDKDNQTQTVSFSVEEAGLFSMTGDFGDLNAEVTIKNGKKTIATGTVKNGEITFNGGKEILLEKDVQYTMSISSTDNGKTSGAFSLTLESTAIFDQNDNSDDSWRAEELPEFDKAQGWEDWVGYGDAVDVRVLTLDAPAKVSFDVTATDQSKFEISNIIPKTGLKHSIKSTSLKMDKDTSEYSVTTKGILLEAGTYYLSVTSSNAKKGGDASYSVKFNESTEIFAEADNSDDDWHDAPAISAGETISNWVGFGDEIDQRIISVNGRDGFYSFELSGLENNAKIEISSVTFNRNGTERKTSITSKTIAVTDATSFTTKRIALKGDGTYLVSVKATEASMGLNTHYTLTMNEEVTFTGFQNNSWKTATVLGEDEAFVGTIAKGDGNPDKVDWIDLANYDSLDLAVDTGAIKVSFYKEMGKTCKVASLTQSDGKTKENILSVSLADGKVESFQIGALDESLRYLKIEAASSKEICSYHLGTLANG